MLGDEETARELTRDLLTATEGRTRVLITHRPVSAADVDQVIHLGRAAQPAPAAVGAMAGAA